MAPALAPREWVAKEKRSVSAQMQLWVEVMTISGSVRERQAIGQISIVGAILHPGSTWKAAQGPKAERLAADDPAG
jgi:hypothetical protein